MSALTEPPEVHGPVPCGTVLIGGVAVQTVCITVNRSVRLRVMELTGGVAALAARYRCGVQVDAQVASSSDAARLEVPLRALRDRIQPLQNAVIVAIQGHSTEGASVQAVVSMLRSALESLSTDYVELQLVLLSELTNKQHKLGGGQWVFPPSKNRETRRVQEVPDWADSTVPAPPLPKLPHALWAASSI